MNFFFEDFTLKNSDILKFDILIDLSLSADSDTMTNL